MTRKSCLVRFVTLICLLALSVQRVSAQEDSKGAERVVEQYFKEFYAQHWKEAVALMHSETLSQIKKFYIQIAENIDNAHERKQFLQLLAGVNSLAEFQKLDSQTLFVDTLNMAWKRTPPGLRAVAKKLKYRVLGSVKEGEIYHVVVRVESGTTNTRGKEINIPVVGVVSARQEDGQWKLLTTMEIQKMFEANQ